jgi:hypothetical protein
MIKIEEVRDNLEGMQGEVGDLVSDIIMAFEDYEFECESTIIVNKNNNEGTEIMAYADSEKAPELKIFVEKNEDEYLIKEVNIVYD